MLLEIAVFNLESAMAAEKAGADRLTFADGFKIGGSTASYGLLTMLRKKTELPVFPVIRIREGDFLLHEEEFEAMKFDVKLCKRLGFEGIVAGVMKPDGTVDEKKTEMLVDMAFPMEVTFPDGFDAAKSAASAIESIINCGCQRIISTVNMQKPAESIKTLQQLIEIADERIFIIPQADVTSRNASKFLALNEEVESLHFSCQKLVNAPARFLSKTTAEKVQTIHVDVTELNKIKKVLKKK